MITSHWWTNGTCHQLIFLPKDKDSKTISDARSLLGLVCNFDFILSHCILKFILSNTNALSKYLQGKSVDVLNARRNTDLTIATLQSCREELHVNNVWEKAQMISNKIKTWMEERAPQIEFKYAHLPRGKQSARLEALVGAIATPQPLLMLQSHYRTNFYYKGLDQIIVELKYRFQSKDNDIANFYDLNYDLIEWDRRLFMRFLKDHPEITTETASDLVDVWYKHQLKEFLPHFSEIAEIFAAIPALPCTAERSFSTLRR